MYKGSANATIQSLGPRGMDKMVHLLLGSISESVIDEYRYKQERDKLSSLVNLWKALGCAESLQTNDGNTMLKDMSVMHPAAKMLVDLSAAQDVEAGDGTTSVVVIAGSLLGAADRLLAKGGT